MTVKTLQEPVVVAQPVAASGPALPRVTSAQFTEKFFSRNLPAIITDAVTDWNMAGRWSPEYLASFIGDKQVAVSVSATGKFDYDPSGKAGTAAGFSEERMSFAEAARQIARHEGDRQLYVMQQNIPIQFPELMKEIRIPHWISKVRDTSINLWVGRNSVTPLHYDAGNNFFTQQYGEKHFTIFAPADTPHLYPSPIDSKMAHLSSVDVDNPDLRAHPNYSLARPVRFTIKAGELLFLPAFWWHHVRSSDVSTSVSIWWMPDLQQYVQAPNGPRKLYRQYETDRLSSLKTTLLAANGLNFSTAAALVLSAGRKWAACLLALAAWDEFIGRLCSKQGITRAQGCHLHNFAPELRETLKNLVRAGVPASILPQANALESMIALAGRVARGEDEQFSALEIGNAIKLAASLEQRG